MANERIEVEIAANVTGLNDAIGKATGQLDKLGNAANQTSPQINKLKKATSGYNSVGIEFSRIIQDAPFGIIGIGNNITQLASSFQQLRNNSTSTGAALKTAFSSIIAPTNLLVLGISAVTTAFTLYSQGVFGAKKELESLDQAQKDFNDTLKETDKLVRAEFYNQILRDLGILEFQITETGRVIKDVFSDKTAEERLTLLGDRIRTATKPELEALAKFLQENLQGSFRGAANATTELEKQIAKADIKTYEQQLELVNNQLKFYKVETDKGSKSTEDFNKIFDTYLKNWNASEDAILRNLKLQRQLQQTPIDILNIAGSKLTGEEGDVAFANPILEIQNKIAQELAKNPIVIEAPIIDEQSFKTFTKKLKEVEDEFKAYGGRMEEAVIDFALNFKNLIQQNMFEAFVGVGDAIGSAFVTGENVLKAIGNTLLKSMANFLGDFGQQLIAFGVAGIAFGSLMEAIKKGGPLSIPAGIGAIAAGVALVAISSAIQTRASQGLSGGAGGVGTSGVGGGAGSSFVGGGIGGMLTNDREIRGELVARGTDLVYVFNEANNRINKG